MPLGDFALSSFTKDVDIRRAPVESVYICLDCEKYGKFVLSRVSCAGEAHLAR